MVHKGGVALHVSQPPAHGVSQQSPPEQDPLAHSSPATQLEPEKLLHPPAPSHTPELKHVSSLAPWATGVHVPGGSAHVWQTPSQAVAQQ